MRKRNILLLAGSGLALAIVACGSGVPSGISLGDTNPIDKHPVSGERPPKSPEQESHPGSPAAENHPASPESEKSPPSVVQHNPGTWGTGSNAGQSQREQQPQGTSSSSGNSSSGSSSGSSGTSSGSSGTSSGSSGASSGSSGSSGGTNCPVCTTYKCTTAGTTTTTVLTAGSNGACKASDGTTIECGGTIKNANGATTGTWTATGNGGFTVVNSGVTSTCTPGG